MRNFAKITFREIAAFYRETDKGKISRNNTQDTKYSIGGTIINSLDNNYSIACVSLCITDQGWAPSDFFLIVLSRTKAFRQIVLALFVLFPIIPSTIPLVPFLVFLFENGPSRSVLFFVFLVKNGFIPNVSKLFMSLSFS